MRLKSLLIIWLLLFVFIPDVSTRKEKPQKSQKKKQKNTSKRIIEGIKARQAEYPFIASLGYHGEHLCGGSIISDTVILTAAHCCFDGLEHPFNPRYLSVAVGGDTWRNAKKFKVSKLITHDAYDSEKIINDVALWILKSKLTEADGVDVVKLQISPINEQTKPVHGTVLGWGFTSSQGMVVQEAAEELFMVHIYSVSLNECRKHYDYIGPGHLCFSSPDRRGSCNGDSGGPLVTRKDSELVQIGLVSFGEDCNNTQPEVYTRISTYYTWIKNNVVKAKKNNKGK